MALLNLIKNKNRAIQMPVLLYGGSLNGEARFRLIWMDGPYTSMPSTAGTGVCKSLLLSQIHYVHRRVDAGQAAYDYLFNVHSEILVFRYLILAYMPRQTFGTGIRRNDNSNQREVPIWAIYLNIHPKRLKGKFILRFFCFFILYKL